MRIGALFGIPIFLHWSFLALVGAIVFWAYTQAGMIGAVMVAGVSSLAFGSVILHEFGHALAARYYGIDTHDVTLYPMGGVAAIESMPEDPIEEIVIAVAGPAVNGVLFLVFSAIGWTFDSQVASTLGMMNVGMGLFNLLPAYPMDGGRVLRASLALKYGHVRATQLAIKFGTFFGWAFLIIGTVALHPTLFLVGGFLLFVLHNEKQRLKERMMDDLQNGKGWKDDTLAALSPLF